VSAGSDVAFGSSFINIGATDSKDPTAPRSVRFVPVDEDIHGWSPFELVHPTCFARQYGVDKLVSLIDDSHRLIRRGLG